MLETLPIFTDDVTDALSLKMKTLALLGFEEEVVSACALVRERYMTTVLVAVKPRRRKTIIFPARP